MVRESVKLVVAAKASTRPNEDQGRNLTRGQDAGEDGYNDRK